MTISKALPNGPIAEKPGLFAPKLKATLDSFETALATPMVPGEHEAWTDALTQARQTAEPVIREYLAQHEAQYKQMLEVDSEMFNRIDLLRQEDRAIANDLRAVGDTIEKLRLKTPVAEPNEARTDKDRVAVVDGGIALVVRIRKQEVAIATWFSEAFNRDRGRVD